MIIQHSKSILEYYISKGFRDVCDHGIAHCPGIVTGEVYNKSPKTKDYIYEEGSKKQEELLLLIPALCSTI